MLLGVFSVIIVLGVVRLGRQIALSQSKTVKELNNLYFPSYDIGVFLKEVRRGKHIEKENERSLIGSKKCVIPCICR